MDSAFIRRSFCYFPLLFLLLFVVLPIFILLVTLLILHPQKPVFSIRTIKLESYKLHVPKSNQQIIFASSLLSFNLSAANPNKVGISYDSSRLHILDRDEGTTVGMVRVPRFYQPPKSKDLSVAAQIIFGCLNLTKILSGKLIMQQDSMAKDESSLSQMRILGDVRAHVRIFHLPLPKFKVSLDCDIRIDRRYLDSMGMAKNQMISFPSNSNLLFNRCSMALYL